ncbi:MAG: hypothetical protein ACK4Y7_04945 [Caldimicrobium sp.]
MKYLLLILAFFVIFWYYKKKRVRDKRAKEALEVEMRACKNCGFYFSISSADIKNKPENWSIQFCSDKCYKEYLEKSGESG